MRPRDRTVPGRRGANQHCLTLRPDPGLGPLDCSGRPLAGRKGVPPRATRWHSIEVGFCPPAVPDAPLPRPARVGHCHRRAIPNPSCGCLDLHARRFFDTASSGLPILDGHVAWARGRRVRAGRCKAGHVCPPGYPGSKKESSIPASNGTLDLARDAWIGAAILKDPAHVLASTAASRIASSDLADGTLAGSPAGNLARCMDPSLKP